MQVVVNPIQCLHGRHHLARISCPPDAHIENQGQKSNCANGSELLQQYFSPNEQCFSFTANWHKPSFSEMNIEFGLWGVALMERERGCIICKTHLRSPFTMVPELL